LAVGSGHFGTNSPESAFRRFFNDGSEFVSHMFHLARLAKRGKCEGRGGVTSDEWLVAGGRRAGSVELGAGSGAARPPVAGDLRRVGSAERRGLSQRRGDHGGFSRR
jgi:hypothetical protein